jgi:hypothetical protein
MSDKSLGYYSPNYVVFNADIKISRLSCSFPDLQTYEEFRCG